MKFIVLAVAGALISACAVDSSKGGGFYPVAQNQADQTLLAQCKYEVKLHKGVAWPDEVRACMQVRGYTRQ